MTQQTQIISLVKLWNGLVFSFCLLFEFERAAVRPKNYLLIPYVNYMYWGQTSFIVIGDIWCSAFQQCLRCMTVILSSLLLTSACCWRCCGHVWIIWTLNTVTYEGKYISSNKSVPFNSLSCISFTYISPWHFCCQQLPESTCLSVQIFI